MPSVCDLTCQMSQMLFSKASLYPAQVDGIQRGSNDSRSHTIPAAHIDGITLKLCPVVLGSPFPSAMGPGTAMPSECDSTWDDFFVWCFGLRHLARLATCPERLSVPSATLAVNTWSRRWPETGDRKRSAEALRSICAPKTAKRASPNAESGRNGAHSVVAEEKHELGKEN